MALHWENLSSTTPSLTPRPPNRPLKIAKLTPCKKPEVAGSAGHCEPGVGRFTDPHPFTCSFFTPYLHCFMFGLCERPLQARLSLLFPFLPISGFSQPPLSEWRRTGLLSPWVGRCSPIRSQLGHTPPTGPVWGFAGVVSLAGPPKPHTGPHRAKFGFPPQKTNSPLPPKGGGAGYRLFGLSGFSPREARCFSAGKGGYFVSEGFSRQLPVATAGHNCPTRLQQGRCGASMVLFSYPAL